MKMTAARLAGAALAVAAMTGAGPAPPAWALPADQVVFMVMSSGGMVPATVLAMQSPSLAVYGDGRVLTAADTPAGQPVPASYRLARADPAGVDRFVAAARTTGLIGASTDFGTPRATDLATTTVLLGGGDGPVEVAVYAFDERFEDGLSPAQRDARARLRTLIGQGAGLSAGALAAPFTPDRVTVYAPRSRPSEEPATAVWPGPPPESFLVPSRARRSTACGRLDGPPARDVYLAAVDNPGARWLVDGETRVLAVNPFPLPGDCP